MRVVGEPIKLGDGIIFYTFAGFKFVKIFVG